MTETFRSADLEILTPDQMAAAERLVMQSGRADGMSLMRRAADAVAGFILERYPDAATVDILCGPGNNGGDGYCVAERLKQSGMAVRVWASAAPRPGSDAEHAAAECSVPVGRLAEFAPRPGALVVDALYGTGLSRGLDGAAADSVGRCARAAARIVSIDLPSGIDGATGRIGTVGFRADATITFERRKMGHVLQPGAAHCGELVVAGIGLGRRSVAAAGPRTTLNDPALWRHILPRPRPGDHKYSRGHVAVFSGGPYSTGAARLCAQAAARSGAGAVTVLSPADALAVNAAHLTSIMLVSVEDAAAAIRFVATRKVAAAAIGPGFGVGKKLSETVLALLSADDAKLAGIVLDADALTAFRDDPSVLFDAIGAADARRVVLTPHDGEFGRLFPDLAADTSLSKLERTRAAASRAGAVVLCKGPDTVIAAPAGDAVINVHGTPYLATAGSGDVLTGLIAGLLAQGMDAHASAAAGAWLHGEAGRRLGRGLMAEDLPRSIPAAMAVAEG